MKQTIIKIDGVDTKCYFITKDIVIFLYHCASYVNVYRVINIHTLVRIRSYYARSMKIAIEQFEDEYYRHGLKELLEKHETAQKQKSTD